MGFFGGFLPSPHPNFSFNSRSRVHKNIENYESTQASRLILYGKNFFANLVHDNVRTRHEVNNDVKDC